MSLHLKDFNLRDLIEVANLLPQSERDVHVALQGGKFIPEDVAAAFFLQRGMHWVAADGAGPIAAGGFLHVRDGVLRTWFMASERAWSEHGAGLTSMTATAIKDVLDQKLAHRIETVTLANQRRARAWYDRIGLQYEATLRGYCSDGEDAVIYVAVRSPERN